jgi:hypothetical protein
MRKSLHRFGLGASRLLPEAATRFGAVLRRPSRARNRKQELLGSVSRRLFFETLEPRLLLSADLVPIQGSIAVPGEVDHHSFTLTNNAHVVLDSQTSGQLDWTLDGPRGSVLSSQPAGSSDASSKSTSLDLVSGTYTLSIAGVGNATGTYQFQLHDLADTPGVAPNVPAPTSAPATSPAAADSVPASITATSSVTAYSVTTLSRLAFVPNQGQAAAGVDFLATGQNYGLAISSNQWDLALGSGNGNGAEVQMHLLGANPSAPASGSQQLPGVTNYINGVDPAQQIMGLPSFARVHYGQVYQGIDLDYYGSNGKLEYDWTVAPGADPGVIRLQFTGTSGLAVNTQGDLLIHTAAGDVVQQAPVLYQDIDGQRVSVAGHYVIEDSATVGFEVGPYDKSRALTIDPILGYSDYLGGAGHDSAAGIATDKDGNTYVVGTTLSASFEGLDTGAGPFSRAFLTKTRADGTLESITLLGPTTKFDASGYALSYGDAVAVDGVDGSVYVVFDSKAGDTVPPDPFVPGTSIIPLPSPDTLHIAKFSSDGTPIFDVATSQFSDADLGTFRAVYSIGNVHLALDGTGAAYMSSEVLNQDNTGVADVPFLQKVSSQGQLEFTKALFVAPDALAVAGPNIFIATSTTEAGLPVSANALQANKTPGSRPDIYVAELDSTASNVIAATYFGGSDYDFVGGLALDPARPGVAYLDGTTASADFPVTNYFSGYKPHAINADNFEGFVSEIDLTKMQLLASTLLGGSGDPALPNSGQDVLSDIALKDGRIYVVGMTNSPDLPLLSPIQTELRTSNDLMANIGATYDFLVAAFDANLTTLEFSTYLGGSGQESGAQYLPDIAGTSGGPVVAVSEDGLIHVAGDTYSPDFPVQGADAGSYAGEGDAVVLTIAQPPTVFGQTNHAGVGLAFDGIVASFDNTRPAASPTDFTATIDWGDGTSSAGEVSIDSNVLTKFDVRGTHTYSAIGDFPVVVRVTDTKTGLNPQTAIDTGNLPGDQFGPSIALDPSVPDRLFAAAVDEKGADAAQAGTGGGIFVSTSTDGGATWSPRRIATDASGEPLPAAFGGAKAVFDGFGNLFLTYVGAEGNDIVLAVSTDGGLTFSKIADLTPQGSTPGKDANGDVQLNVDHPSIAVGNPLVTAGDFTATINWGDGSLPTAGTVAFDGTQFTISGTHIYLRVGQYPFSVSVTDPEGVTTTKAASGTQGAGVQASFSPNLGWPASNVLLSADFNNDGKLDLVAGPIGFADGQVNEGQMSVSVLLGNGDFTFGPPIDTGINLLNRYYAVSAVAADFNGDGKLDFAVSTDAGGLYVLLGNGDGTFTPGPQTFPFGYGGRSMAAGDFDGDGNTDLAISWGSADIQVLRGNGDGSFQVQDRVFLNNRLSFAHPYPSFAVADLNNDHRSDIVVADGSNFLKIYMAGPGGVFGSPKQVDIGPPGSWASVETVAVGVVTSVESVAVGDVTGDGIPDIVVGASDLVVLAGDGTGNFAAPVHYATPVAPMLLAVGDLDNDGRADVVVGDFVGRPVDTLKAVAAEEVCRRLVGEGAVGVECQRAVSHGIDQHGRQAIAVRIRIICEHARTGYRQRCIFLHDVVVVEGDRRAVDLARYGARAHRRRSRAVDISDADRHAERARARITARTSPCNGVNSGACSVPSPLPVTTVSPVSVSSDVTTSSLPSPFMSASARPSGLPSAYVTAGLNVPSAVPVRASTLPISTFRCDRPSG